MLDGGRFNSFKNWFQLYYKGVEAGFVHVKGLWDLKEDPHKTGIKAFHKLQEKVQPDVMSTDLRKERQKEKEKELEEKLKRDAEIKLAEEDSNDDS